MEGLKWFKVQDLKKLEKHKLSPALASIIWFDLKVDKSLYIPPNKRNKRNKRNKNTSRDWIKTDENARDWDKLRK